MTNELLPVSSPTHSCPGMITDAVISAYSTSVFHHTLSFREISNSNVLLFKAALQIPGPWINGEKKSLGIQKLTVTSCKTLKSQLLQGIRITSEVRFKLRHPKS